MEFEHSLSPGTELGTGEAMHALMTELFPFNRSLTGEGVRSTLAALGRRVPLRVVETPSGTQVFDWSVPPEWNVREAWIETPDGARIADFAESNLHLLGYSVPVDETLPLDELRDHLFTHPEPELVPYRTAYWARRWGFCISRRQLEDLPEGNYRVHIDATLEPGSLSYGELAIAGRTEQEFLLTTYVCHPSLANDNLSGIVVLAALAEALSAQPLRYSYRFVWSPGTLGPLCWLHKNLDRLDRVEHGLVISCLGDPGPFTYKRSRRGHADIDAAAEYALSESGLAHTIRSWTPLGGDERQFCSPGFNLPVGAFSRSPADAFPEYHSSADNLDFVRPEALQESLQMLLRIVEVVEQNETYVNRTPYGEPQLGRRGLYRPVGGESSSEGALLWVLNQSDGSHNLLDIAQQSGLPLEELRSAADALEENELVERATRADLEQPSRR
jgi:aminopeptidase-like protein